MNSPNAASWAPPESDHGGRRPSFDCWRVGDWLLAERDARGYVPAARVSLALRVLRLAGTSVSRQYLYLIAHVSRGVESERRREALSRSHHREVAHLDAERQEAALELAERDELSCTQLRDRLRGRDLGEAA